MPLWWLLLKFLQPGFLSAESLRQSWELPWKNRLCWGPREVVRSQICFTHISQMNCVFGLIEATPDGVFIVLKIFRIEKFWHKIILFCYHFEKNCSLLRTCETESAKYSVSTRNNLLRLLWLMESTAVLKQWQKITAKNALLTRPAGGHFFQGVPAVVPFKVWKEKFHRGLQDVFLLFNRLLNLRIRKAEGLEH